MTDQTYRILVGDVRERLAALADGSVDCIVTSPPYFGLRDYGTGSWEGGDPSCDHARPTTNMNQGFNERWGQGAGQRKQETKSGGQYAGACPRCGALRIDKQIGLEATPGEYVAALAAVFEELRRVLAPHGTCWLNLGDSYAGDGQGYYDGDDEVNGAGRGHARRPRTPPGLKPKDLIGIPWRVAFALQDQGWWLRQEVIWSKMNPMPESIQDRPSRSHEQVFMLTRSRRYWFDREAVRSPAADRTVKDERQSASFPGGQGGGDAATHGHRGRPLPTPFGGRNVRSVWEIPTGRFAGAHFAVFPIELPTRCVLAGAPREVCVECGRPRERIVERLDPILGPTTWSATGAASYDDDAGGYAPAGDASTLKHVVPTRTVGWTDCGHGAYRRGLVLDPFLGAGTTALAALRAGRDAVGIELSPEYAEMAGRRLARWWDDDGAAPTAEPPEGQLTLA